MLWTLNALINTFTLGGETEQNITEIVLPQKSVLHDFDGSGSYYVSIFVLLNFNF